MVSYHIPAPTPEELLQCEQALGTLAATSGKGNSHYRFIWGWFRDAPTCNKRSYLQYLKSQALRPAPLPLATAVLAAMALEALTR